MDHLIPSLAQLLDPFRECFRAEVATTFRALLAAWILCPGPRTLSEVWQATGWAAARHHDTAYAVFRSAAWDWDDLGRILLRLLVAALVPHGRVEFVVDDTLTHKRGSRVAFGGMFLDPVTSSRWHKNFRFGLNWVVLALVVRLPGRPDRSFALPVLWRLYRKPDTPGYRPRTALAAELVRLAAAALPERACRVVADAAYVNAALLADRPGNVHVLGPLRLDACLYARPPAPAPGRRGKPPARGARLPSPAAMFDDPLGYPAVDRDVALPKRTRRLRLQVVREVLWYRRTVTPPVTLVLVRDPAGAWRDLTLLSTEPGIGAEEAVLGYGRRWGIEVAFRESKQYLGLHDPRVWSPRSVERAHPMAWFVQSLTVLWYATSGGSVEQVRRERPWYRQAVSPTFAEMLGALRLQLWDQRISEQLQADPSGTQLLEFLRHWLAAVR